MHLLDQVLAHLLRPSYKHLWGLLLEASFSFSIEGLYIRPPESRCHKHHFHETVEAIAGVKLDKA